MRRLLAALLVVALAGPSLAARSIHLYVRDNATIPDTTNITDRSEMTNPRVNENFTNLRSGIQGLEDDLASASGASRIGVADTADNFAATILEDVLAELYGLVTGGAVTWGNIVGSPADQADLQALLDAKQPLDADLTDLADGTLSKSKVEDSGNWDAAHTHAQETSGNPHQVAFSELGEVPAYAGNQGKVLKVNPTEDGLVAEALTGGGDMLASNNLSELTDKPAARTNLSVDVAGTAASLIGTHAGAADPHAGYMRESVYDATGDGLVDDAAIVSTIARDTEVTGALNTHSLDGIDVHGIADTSALLDAGDIGATVQPFDTDLSVWAGVTSSANGRSLVSAADFSAMRTLLSLVPGTHVLAPTGDGSGLSGVIHTEADPLALKIAGTDNVKDTHLDWGVGVGQISADDIPDGATNAIPTLTQEANWDIAYGWGDHAGLYQAENANLTTFSLISPTANVQSLLGAFDFDAMRTLLSLQPGTDVQAFDADLAQLAALECGDGQLAKKVAGVWDCAADDGGAGGGYTTVLDEGISLTQRTVLNFVGTALTASDDVGNTRTNVTADPDLNAIAALTGTGVPKRTGVDSWGWAVPGTDWEAAGSVATHAAGSDPHAGYMRESVYDVGADGLVDDAAIASTIARDSEVSGAVSTHVGLADPHTQYATDTDLSTHATNISNPHGVTAAQAGADPAGTAASTVGSHESDTTSIHGIADTSALLDTGDIGVTVQAPLVADTDYLTPGTAGTTYALVAAGVTGGDTHDHSGGDGAQIAYATLSGTPTLGTAADNAEGDFATAAQGASADTAFGWGDHDGLYDLVGSAAGVQGNLDTHEGASTSVHGIADTSALLTAETDPVVGAVDGIVECDGLGNCAASTSYGVGADGEHYVDVSNTNDTDTTGWGASEEGRLWYNQTASAFRYWDGNSAENLPGGSGAVDSVNGQTGVVVLDAADVGADPAGTAASVVAGVIVTSVGDPGSDASVPSEQAVREALDALPTGGSGTINSGTQYHLPFYTAAGTTVGDSGITAASDGTAIQTVKGTTADGLTLMAGTTGGETTGWRWEASDTGMADTFTAKLPAGEPSAGQVLLFGAPSTHVSAVSYATPVLVGDIGTTVLAPNGDGSGLSGVVTTETDSVVGAVTGLVKADGGGNISAAAAGTDYQAPLVAGTDYQTPLVAGTDYQTPLVAGTDYLAPNGDGSGLTSVDAATGDSATAFFDSGTIEHERGGLEADVSGYSGLVKISGGATSQATRADHATAANLGSFASPTVSNPYTLTAANAYAFLLWYGATGEIDLPAGAAGMNGCVYNTGAFTITLDPNASEVVVRDGTAQTGGVSVTLSSGAGNYVCLVHDGARWVTLGYQGTLGEGS